MTEADRLRLRGWVKQAEGYRSAPYRDSLGFLTIGFGRLIDPDHGGGISKDEAEYMLANDLRRCERECESMPAYLDLSPARQGALVEMCFNLGAQGLQRFKQMFGALVQQDYELAAHSMMASRWAGQVGTRAVRLAEQMKTGQWTP